MKNFLKKRWHGIPVGIISAVLAVCLLGMGVYAAYTFLPGVVEVQVDEAITVYYGPNSTLLVEDFTVPISGYPGESVNVTLRITSASAGDLTVKAAITGCPPGMTWSAVGDLAGLFSSGVVIPGKGSEVDDIVCTLSGEIVPGNYTVNFTFSRS